jgi:nucleotide-binding universal stress UspA family protein
MPALVGAQQELEAAARESLSRLIVDDDRRRLTVKPVVLTGTMAATAILDYAKDALIDLIIVGTHGRGRVVQFFMGSVAERLVRAAPCPVLTVRQAEHEFLRPDTLERAAER